MGEWGGLQENLLGLMWCGASASTRIHETVRHTWRFDFYSSNSFSVVLSSTVWNMSSWKKSMFVRFSFCSFFFSFGASLPCLSLFWVFVLLLLPLLFFFFSGVVCFISQAIWLTSESNFVPVWPCNSPFPTDTLAFTHFPKLTHRLHTPNKSILHLLQLGATAHSSSENVHAVVNVPGPQWLRESSSYL